jgi:cytochrome o ubiquinol oxidase subunit 2
VLYPSGDVARQQAHLLAVSTLLMLLIIIPVMALTVLFAWRYRHTNKDATYHPDWGHSTMLELVIWAIPLLIIIMLGAITWISTHTLDPYRKLDRLAPGKPVAANAKPLEIDVIALDWKWLFIYPEQGIATVNQLPLPTDREVHFRLTASSVMNSFYIPALAGQVYAMPAMETQLHAVLNRAGRFEGFSANYSGAGFSGMHFKAIGMDETAFDRWAAATKSGANLLDLKAYARLAKPSENVPPKQWGAVDPQLYGRILNVCTLPGQTCMSDTMRHDMAMPGSHPPMTDTDHPQPGEPKGALLRKPEEKGSAPRPASPAPDAPAPASHS